MAKGLPKSLKEAARTGSFPAATPTNRGTVTQGVHVPNAAAAPTKAEFDALLTSLRNAGVIASA